MIEIIILVIICIILLLVLFKFGLKQKYLDLVQEERYFNKRH